MDHVNKDPLEVLRLAEKKVQSWELAQIELHTENHGPLDLEARSRVRDISRDTTYLGYLCLLDGF